MGVDLAVEVSFVSGRGFVLGRDFFDLGVGGAVKGFGFIRSRLAGDCHETGGDSGQEEDGLKFHKNILLLKLKSC